MLINIKKGHTMINTKMTCKCPNHLIFSGWDSLKYGFISHQVAISLLVRWDLVYGEALHLTQISCSKFFWKIWKKTSTMKITKLHSISKLSPGFFRECSKESYTLAKSVPFVEMRDSWISEAITPIIISRLDCQEAEHHKLYIQESVILFLSVNSIIL